MTEPRDEFDAWRDRDPVEPMSPRPGAFERIDAAARHRRRTRFAGGGVAVVAVVVAAALVPGVVRDAYQSRPPGTVTVVPDTGGTSGGPRPTPVTTPSGARTHTPQSTGSAPGPTHSATERKATESATGAPPPSADSSPTHTARTVPRCHSADLSVTVDSLGGGAGGGQRYAKVVFANTSGRACTMYGSIGMQLVAADGTALHTDVTRLSSDATRVTVLPSGHAVTIVRWTRVPSGSSDCATAPATVKIIPPNDYSQLSASWPGGKVCSHGALETVPVVAGTDPPPI